MNTVNRQARPLRHLLLLILVTAGMIFLYGQIPYTTEPYARWDLYHYRQITAAAADYGWRTTTLCLPLVGALPGRGCCLCPTQRPTIC